MAQQQDLVQGAVLGLAVDVPADRVARRNGSGARHRQHVFPGRGLVVKARYTEDERAAVAQAAMLTGLRPAGFVAAAALLLARSLAGEEQDDAQVPAGEDASPDGAGAARPPTPTPTPPSPPVLAGRPVLVSWSAGQDRHLLEELIQARLALRRYGVNVNQAVAALNSGGPAPVWLEQAIAGSNRAVARVDEATAALTRRLI